MFNVSSYIILLIAACYLPFICAKKFKENEKPDWAKKDIRDYSDADLERLFDQWEEDEEPLPEDELPEYARSEPKFDFDKLKDMNDPMSILKLSKKGKTLMTFVQVDESLPKEEADQLTKLWQGALWNNHIQAERYPLEDNRAIFMYKDGSQAWDAKDYLVEQPSCKSITIENKVYEGKHFTKEEDSESSIKDEL